MSEFIIITRIINTHISNVREAQLSVDGRRKGAIPSVAYMYVSFSLVSVLKTP